MRVGTICAEFIIAIVLILFTVLFLITADQISGLHFIPLAIGSWFGIHAALLWLKPGMIGNPLFALLSVMFPLMLLALHAVTRWKNEMAIYSQDGEFIETIRAQPPFILFLEILFVSIPLLTVLFLNLGLVIERRRR